MEKHIPFDLIIQILCRLPVQSLLRFQCVCKQWCLLMKDKNFINFQLQQCRKTDNLVSYDWNLRFLSMDLNSMQTKQVVLRAREKESIPPYDFIQLIGTCNGLICFSSFNDSTPHWDKDIVLWNMCTGEYLILPTPPNISSEHNLIGVGFGFDSINDDYKVIKIFETWKFRCTIFYSLRSKSWGKITRWDCYRTFGYIGNYANGAVHWVAFDKQVTFLLAYDINTEKQQIVQLPDQIRSSDYDLPNILVPNMGVVADLYICHQSNRPPFLEMWVMKEYGVKESWTRLFCVDSNEVGLGRSFYPFKCCCFNNGDDQEVLLVAHDYLFYYNLRNKTFRGVSIAPRMGFPLIYHQSLVKIWECD